MKRFLLLLLSGGVALALLLRPVQGERPSPKKSATQSGASVALVLSDSWERYKSTFIQADGRVIDYSGNVTTSEGQAYALLRAFWMRDKATFDRVYRWAKDNLQIPRGDSLFSWKWGQKPDQTWGALDQTSAADADQDIALALLLAWQIWREPTYLADARLILNELWERLTLETPVGRILLPGDWPVLRPASSREINPSYFAPYAYRIFAEVDPGHDWRRLTDSSYEILTRSLEQTTTHLPPDWVEVALDKRQASLYTEPSDQRSDFGYEAIRVYWRIALDALLTPSEKRADALLAMHTPLSRYWKIRQEIPIGLTWDGIRRTGSAESGAVYGAVLPALSRSDRLVAEEVLQRKVLPALQAGSPWNSRNDYYSQNWLWFGLALYQRETTPPDLPEKTPLARLAHLLQETSP